MLTPDNVDILIERLQTELPYHKVTAYVSKLGGVENMSVMVTIMADPEHKWANGILQNSTYAKISIEQNGRVELFGGRNMKMRAFQAKGFDQIIDRLSKITIQD